MPTAITTETVGKPTMTYTEPMTEYWCRSLIYTDYVAFAAKFRVHCVPERCYALFCQAMDLDMEHHIGVERPDLHDVLYPNGLMF